MKRTRIQAVILALSTAFIAFSAPGIRTLADDEFIRGDVNADGRVSISDTLMLRRFLFNFDRAPTCVDAADVDDDGRAWLSDAINILAMLFTSRTFGCESVGSGGEIVRHTCGPFAEPSAAPGADPTPDQGDFHLDCSAYDPVPPSETGDTVRLGVVRATPGSSVKIPIHVSNSVEVEAFQLVIGYDADLFAPTPTHEPGGEGNLTPEFDGTFFADREAAGNGLFAIVESHAEESAFTVGLISHFIETGHEIPPGEDTLVAWIHGTVSPHAPAGVEIALELLDEGIPHMGMRNELTYRGEARYVSAFPRLVDGALRIVPDIGFFIRGDSNGDRTVDVSDAVTVLGYLFTGDAELDCKDAADADDSGTIVITDAIVILNHLFSGALEPIAPPHPTAGDDPTWNDDLGDCRV